MSDCFNMITFPMDSQVLIFKDVLDRWWSRKANFPSLVTQGHLYVTSSLRPHSLCCRGNTTQLFCTALQRNHFCPQWWKECGREDTARSLSSQSSWALAIAAILLGLCNSGHSNITCSEMKQMLLSHGFSLGQCPPLKGYHHVPT